MAKQGRGATRAQRKRELAEAAARVAIPASIDVCVVGGGAAGLVAAITAAEAGAQVVVLERDAECGRTILATGNGRCNFANAHLDPALYNDPSFVGAVTGVSWLEDVLTFFRDCGLAWETEAEGRMYPLSHQAASVRNVLLQRAVRADVVMAPLRKAVALERAGAGFQVTYQDLFASEQTQSLAARRLVVATGGGVPTLCEALPLQATPFQPLLCPLACEGPLLDLLDGRRVQAKVTLSRKGAPVASQRGEVLFRTYGLSGIVVFNLSRLAQAGDEVTLDLLPSLDTQKARDLATHTLDGLVDPVIAQALTQRTGSASQALALARRLPYRVQGVAYPDHAQVNRGGLNTSQFDPHTLQAHDVPGLFACGEALDVDGPCGGFNLAWAWKSGLVAGSYAGLPQKETNP